jgi:hypothetical protein
MLSTSPATTTLFGLALSLLVLSSAVRSDTLRKDPDILVVYIGAEDCAPCRQWQGGMGAKFRTSNEFRHLRYREIESPQLFRLLNDEVWPADLRGYRQRIDRTMGVPMWLVILNGDVVTQGYGVSQWANTIIPTLRQLLD